MRRAILRELNQLPRRMGGTTGVLICAFALLASPDGRYLAITDATNASDAWLLANSELTKTM